MGLLPVGTQKEEIKAMAKLTAQQIIELARAEIADTKTIAIEGWGDFVLRKITIAEQMQIQKDADGDANEASKLAFTIGIVEPSFTKEEVDALWANTTMKRLQPISDALSEFNGLSTPKAVVEDSFPVQPAKV